MKQDAILSLLAPTMGELLPPGAPPQAMAMLMSQIGGKVKSEPPTAYWGNATPETDLQEMAKRMARRRFGPGQYGALEELLERESGWDPHADNPTSSAHGLFQFLDSTRENYNLPLHAGPRRQMKAGLRYIADRYTTPQQALAFHTAHGYY